MRQTSLAALPSRLYGTYASRHVCSGGDEAAALDNRRDIHPALSARADGPAVDLVCGRGELVRLQPAGGFGEKGINSDPVSQYSWCTLRQGLRDDQIARDLATANLFVLATRTGSTCRDTGEGLAIVLLEAPAAGTPTIVPPCGGSREANIEGVTGVASADESAQALTSALRELPKDPIRLAWMAGHTQRIRQTFAAKAYAQLAARRLL